MNPNSIIISEYFSCLTDCGEAAKTFFKISIEVKHGSKGKIYWA